MLRIGMLLTLVGSIARSDAADAESPLTRPGTADLTIPAGDVLAMSFSPNCQTIVTLSRDEVVSLWDTSSGRLLKSRRLALAIDERLIRVEEQPEIRASADGDVAVLVHRYEGFHFDQKTGVATQGKISSCLWSMTTGKRSPFIPTGYGGMAVCPKGQRLAYGNGLWDIATGQRIQQLNLPDGMIFDIGFSPDGKTLAYQICEGLAQNSSVIYLADAATGKKVFQAGDLASFLLLAPPTFSPVGQTIAYGDREGTIHLKNLASGREVRTAAKVNEELLGFSSAGKSLISWNSNWGVLRFWGTATGKPRRSIEIGKHVRMLTLAPDGQTLALMRGQAVEICQLAE